MIGKIQSGHNFNWLMAASVSLIVGFFGLIVVMVTFAAGQPAVFEPESGILSGGAVVQAFAGASGGQVVKFGSAAAPSPTPAPTITPSPSPSGNLTAQDLAAIAGQKIFFGHQSVGLNILSGVPLVYSAYGAANPSIVSASSLPTGSGGYIAEAYVGSNTQPYLKISDFDAKIRGGLGSKVGIAFFKFCYVDITAGTDAQALFNQYKSTMAALARDYPNVKFLHVTNPLTVADTADNVVRERYNALVRAEYGGTGRLYDLALVESTAPNGSRVGSVSNGSTYYSTYSGYSSDGGHLNAAGQQVAAKALLIVLANVIR